MSGGFLGLLDVDDDRKRLLAQRLGVMEAQEGLAVGRRRPGGGLAARPAFDAGARLEGVVIATGYGVLRDSGLRAASGPR